MYCTQHKKENKFEFPAIKGIKKKEKNLKIDPNQLHCNIVSHVLEMLVILVFSLEEFSMENSKDWKETLAFITQLKSHLWGLFKNDKIEEEFRIQVIFWQQIFIYGNVDY